MPRLRRQSSESPPIEIASVGTDQAWKMFDVISQLVRASEVKSSATLAADGVAATALYNIIRDETHIGALGILTLAACLTVLLASGLCVACALVPRLWIRGTPDNLIYFNHVARRYSKFDDYLDAFRKLTVNEDELVRQIGAQIWANAKIARRKFLWSAWALILFFLGLLLLIATVLAVKT